MYKINLEHFIAPKVRKGSKNDGDISKVYRSQLKGPIIGQLSTKVYTDSNRL